MKHCEGLSNEAGRLGAQILETEIMQNREETLTRCFMTNLGLPMKIGNGEKEIPEKDAYRVAVWMTATMSEEYDIYSPVFTHGGKFWTRWSGQIYLEMKDYANGAEALKVLCKRAKNGEYLGEEKI